jgi:hypothetical protein
VSTTAIGMTREALLNLEDALGRARGARGIETGELVPLSVLRSPESLFHCFQFRCTLRARVCLARQDMREGERPRWAACSPSCEQGARVRAQVPAGESVEDISPARQDKLILGPLSSLRRRRTAGKKRNDGDVAREESDSGPQTEAEHSRPADPPAEQNVPAPELAGEDGQWSAEGAATS